VSRCWRVHDPRLPASAGEIVQLADDEAHHVRRVLRLDTGETLAIFDGRGAEWRGTIVECGESVRVRLDAPLEDPVDPALEVVLFQALAKPAKIDWVVQKATEIGLGAVRILVTERSDRDRRLAQRVERWRRIAVEACKHSGRRRIPAIDSVAALPDPGTEAEIAVVLDPREGAPPLGAFCAASVPRSVWIASGPESGFAAEEIAGWSTAGWRRASLGPRILRAETAGIVAGTIFLHRWADLGPGV
jgi:16S rRNA (uracil1498-N3)-methyltransferase